MYRPSISILASGLRFPEAEHIVVGIATIFYHMLGDVPAPIIIGKMIDVFIARVETERQIIVYRGVLQGLMSLSILLVGLGLDCEE